MKTNINFEIFYTENKQEKSFSISSVNITLPSTSDMIDLGSHNISNPINFTYTTVFKKASHKLYSPDYSDEENKEEIHWFQITNSFILVLINNSGDFSRYFYIGSSF